MKYDVFISYSRRDFEEVNAFVNLLHERIPSLSCWFDITGIESGEEEFDEKIISTIDNSSYVLFALSDNSLHSKWAKKEVTYAQNTNKRVIPLLLNGAELKGWFLFDFGRVNCIDSTNFLQVNNLLNNLSKWTGKSLNTSDAVTNPQPEHKHPQTIKQESSPKREGPASPANNGHEYVDLGLSVKWATCNVGATKPEEYGDYFAWGEVKPKDEYTEDNSITYGKDGFSDISGDARYDAARANWGGSWRLPTRSELRELCEKCTWEWVKHNDVAGYKVTGPNGNSIFLPAAGYRGGPSLSSAGSDGLYWSAMPDESDSYYAYGLDFYSSDQFVLWNYRDDGQSVRPVTE